MQGDVIKKKKKKDSERLDLFMSECSGLDKVHQRSHLLWVAMQGMVWEYRTPGQVVLYF